MTTTSIGYDGTVTEQAFASLFGVVGAGYGVLGATDLQVLVGGGGAGSITVKAGSAFGKGVLDTFSADNTSLAAATVSSGTRWDTVVITRNWSGTGGTTTIAINPGTSTKQVTRTNTTPGTLDDQPIALIRSVAGLSAVQEIVDLRTWPHKVHYAAAAAAIPFMTHLPGLGSRIYAGDNGHEFLVGSGGLVDLDGPAWTNLTLAGGAGALVAVDIAPQYSINRGRVFLRGTIKRGTPSGPLISSTMATDGSQDPLLTTLPAAARPLHIVRGMFGAISTPTGIVRAYLNIDGTLLIRPEGANINAIALDGFSYFVGQ